MSRAAAKAERRLIEREAENFGIRRASFNLSIAKLQAERALLHSVADKYSTAPNENVMWNEAEEFVCYDIRAKQMVVEFADTTLGNKYDSIADRLGIDNTFRRTPLALDWRIRTGMMHHLDESTGELVFLKDNNGGTIRLNS